jgi:hypothetical protein
MMHDFTVLAGILCVGMGVEADWCRRGESNPRPRDYETLALPLSYAGKSQFFMLRIRVRMCQDVVTATS